MKVHEVLEACVEHVAMDGVLGTDPLSVQRHLESLDASIDATSFSHIYRLLSRHPSILVTISTVPLTLPDGSVQLGTAPLPAGYVPPTRQANSDFIDLFSAGARGTQMTKALRGTDSYNDYVQGARARRDKEEEGLSLDKRREMRARQAAELLVSTEEVMQIKGENGEILFTILDDDDAPLKAGETVTREDLAGLMQKWGSRLRIRCTEDEVYFRLTGTHTRLGKISKPVLQSLQLCARSRERGITAIELGPLLGTTQGTMHYYMKVLVDSGLCSKLPMIQHGATTNLLIFHKYLERNPSYRSLKQLGPLPVVRPRSTAQQDEDDDDETGNASNLNFERTPLSESDLMTGIIVKDRLIQILDHPGLTNHLLRDKNLLELLGWNQPYATRHRRSLVRHIDALAAAGVVERLLVGHRAVDCLRLTKYNPDLKTLRPARVVEDVAEDMMVFDADAFTEPLNPLGGVNTARSLEYTVSQKIKEAGDEGITHAQIRERSGNPYSRFTEFYVDRAAKLWVPDHLGGYAIREIIENAGKERRLRIYDEAAYYRHLESLGQAVDAPTVDPEKIGVFADVSYRQFATSLAHQRTMLHYMSDGRSFKSGPKGAKKLGRLLQGGDPYGASAAPSLRGVPDTWSWQAGATDADFIRAPKLRYTEGSTQIRGRPRKYLYVVTPTGKIDRNVIGQVKSRADLVPVWIYLKDKGVLVPAPTHFTGLGVVPEVTEDMMADAKEPEWFEQFENAKNAKQSKGKKKGKGKGKAVAVAVADSDEDAEVVVVETPAAKGQAKAKAAPATTTNVVAAPESTGTVVIDTPSAKGKCKGKAAASAKPASAVVAAAAPHQGVDIEMLDNTAVTPTSKATKRKSTVIEEPSAARKSRRIADAPVPAATVDIEGSEPMTRRSGRNRQAVATQDVSAQEHERTSTTEIQAQSLPTPTVTITPQPQEPEAISTQPTKRALSPQAVDAESQKRQKKGEEVALTHDLESVVPSPTKQSSDPPSPINPAPTLVPPKFGVRLPEKAPIIPPKPPPPVPTTIRWRKALATPPAPRQRIDLGLVRRMNELCVALQENGGVLLDSRHLQAHKVWAERVAGTDAPHAPITAYGMDRTVYKQAIDRMESHGRIKRTKAMVQTFIGRWAMQDVVHLPDVPLQTVLAYCAALQAEETHYSHRGKNHPNKVEVEAQGYTRLGRAGAAGPLLETGKLLLEDQSDRPGTARRNILLREPQVGATLMGWQPGQHARAQTLHIEMCRVFRLKESANIIATSPNIVLLSLLLDDISVGAFFKCISIVFYDEALDDWLHEGDNASTPLKDVPERFRAAASFDSAASKTKLKTLLMNLADLQVITPLIPCPKARAELSADTLDQRSGKHFMTAPAVGKATHLILHSVAPLYNIADVSGALLGQLPLRTEDEVETFWAKAQEYAVKSAIPKTGGYEGVSSSWPDIAHYHDRIDVAEERQRYLGNWARWQSGIRLLDQQNDAINAVANQVELSLIDDDISQLAYENALPVAYVKTEVYRRHGSITFQRAKAARERQEAEADQRRRRLAAQETLRAKMESRRQELKRAWDRRIEYIAGLADVEYSEQLVNFVNRRAMAMNKSTMSDATIREIIKLSKTQMGTAEDLYEQEQQMAYPLNVPMPMGKRKPKAPITSDQRLIKLNPEGFAQPAAAGKRRRFNWTPEMDELLIDAEAVIRARSIGRGNRGRKAMGKLAAFNEVGYQNIRVRLTRLRQDPAKDAYFNHLVGAWRQLWLQKRGTPELPDPNWEDVDDFPIGEHIEYMRAHLVKGDISAAVAEQPRRIQTQLQVPDLPSSVEELLEQYKWQDNASRRHNLSIMWDDVAQEQRMAAVLGSSFDNGDETARRGISREKGVIRGLLKTIFSTHKDDYNATVTEQQLSRYSLADEINPELAALMDNKQVICLHTASGTGRFYGYHDESVKATKGPLPPDLITNISLFTQAGKLHHMLDDKPDGYDMPVIADAGEYAALFQMVSDGTVDLDIDISKMSIVRKSKGTFNTRKMNDAGFEMPLKVKLVGDLPRNDEDPPNPRAVPATDWPSSPQTRADEELQKQIMDEVEAAGPDGVDKAELYGSDLEPSSIDHALAALTSSKPAVIFWAGYDTARIVSIKHSLAWMQPVIRLGQATDATPTEHCMPRRWVDLYGELIKDDLEKCIRCAVSHITVRPGIRENVLRKKLALVLDRQEATDLLSPLVRKGLAVRKYAKRADRCLPPVEATGVTEECNVVWYPLQPWYA